MSWNIDIPRSLNSCDSFPRRKVENRAPTSILSLTNISVELHVKVVEEIDLEMCIVGNCRKFKCFATLTLTLDRVKVTSTYTVHVELPTCQPCDYSVTHYGNMAAWISWNTDIGRSLNSRDSFPRRKFKNWAQTSCSRGPILSPWTISIELHAKVAEEIEEQMCSYGQLSEVQMLRDLDLGWGQGHININSTCRTTSLPNHVTVASRTTKIWPFEFREIWTLGEVWTLVIAFLEGNSKTDLRQAVVQVPYYRHQPSVLSPAQKWRRR